MTRSTDAWSVKYGPWALVTGATDGIGRAIAAELATRGLNLVLVARRKAVLEEVSGDLRARYGIEVAAVDADLGDPTAVARVLEETKAHNIGLFAGCAGFGTSGLFLKSDAETELNMVDVNCRAVLHMTHAFAQRFAARGSGGLILMSSLVAFQGVPYSANYAATKAYIQTLAEGLRVEMKAVGVDVLASAPGPVNSGFAARADMKMGDAAKPAVIARDTVAALGRTTTVRPGFLSKVLIGSLSMLPRWGRTAIMRAIMGGMVKHQHAGGQSH